MKEYEREIALCGILPCVCAADRVKMDKMLDALAAEGFPAAEVDATASTEGAISVAFHRADIATGALVCDAAQAEAMLALGAAWVTLPLTADNAAAGHGATHSMHGAQEETENLLLSTGDETPRITLCCPVQQAEALLAAYPGARLMLSGCETPEQGCVWLANPRVTALRLAVNEKEATVQRLKQFWADTLDFTLAHIGINSSGAVEAEATAKAFSALLGMPYKPGSASDYAGTIIEVMKPAGRGAYGHIGITTADLQRGMYFAQRAGYAFDPESRKNDANGRAILYYLKQELAGFAVHLLQR